MYDRAVQLVKEEKEALLENLTKTCGFVMGIEFKEGSLLVNSKTDVPAKKGQCVCVRVCVCVCGRVCARACVCVLCN